jgi:hypothetical protein
VPRKGPQIILSTEKDEIILDKLPVVLESQAYDWEDGPITNADAFVWNSDRDGPLGFGSWITLSKLSSGKHKITLTVYDSDKNTSTASVYVTVRDKKQ